MSDPVHEPDLLLGVDGGHTGIDFLSDTGFPDILDILGVLVALNDAVLDKDDDDRFLISSNSPLI